jgi:hypothetical protein
MGERERCSLGKIGRSFQFPQHSVHPNSTIGEGVVIGHHSVYPQKIDSMVQGQLISFTEKTISEILCLFNVGITIPLNYK